MFWIIVLLITIILISINALYVAAEFSTVSSRRSRLSQYAADGNRNAARLLSIVEDASKLDMYVASCQIGITISSLILGFYSQGTVADAVVPLLARLGVTSETAAQSVGVTVVLLSFTILQVLLGELVPKNVAIQYPERVATLMLLPMRWSITIFKPLIWLFNGSGMLLMRLLKLHVASEHAHVHSPEEIAMLVEESGSGGVLNQEEHRLLRNTLQMHDAPVRQVMIPRPQMLAASQDLPCEDLLALLAESRYSRLPLYEGTQDNIVGTIHIRDLLCLGFDASAEEVQCVVHPVQYVPENMLARDVLALLQRQHLHFAVVLDEFGGTAGIVTIEDLLEEIFGEIQDEFDGHVSPLMQVAADNWIWIRGDAPIEDVVAMLDLHLPLSENVDTIGGLMLDALGHIPTAGEEIQIAGCRFRIVRMVGLRVNLVGLAVTPTQMHTIKAKIS